MMLQSRWLKQAAYTACTQVLRRFEQTGSLRIEGAASIAELAELALDEECAAGANDQACSPRQ